MSNPNIDYTSTNFEFPTLTKIQGIPTYEPLRKIKNEMKSNAASVPCDLGGGAHGHLGIMLSATEYANVSLVNYVRPVHPGILSIPAGTANYESTRLTNEHKELVRLNREANNVEASLLKQLSKALPELYLKSFRNEYSNTFTVDLQTILHYLFTTYGYITPEELQEQKDKLCAKTFDIQQPLIILFDELEELQNIAVAASNPYTDTQIVNIALTLIKNFNDFEKGLTSWFELPIADHTLINFKTHFEREYLALRRVRGNTMRNTSYFQQANSMSTMMQTMKEERDLILHEVKDSEYKILRAMETSENKGENIVNHRDDNNTPPRSNQAINQTSNDTVQLEILKLLREMRDDNNSNRNSNNNNNNGRNSNNNNGRNGNNRNSNNNRNSGRNSNNNNNGNNNNNSNNNNNGNNNNNRNTNNNNNSNNNNNRSSKFVRDVSHYCYTHGACSHDSKDCFKVDNNHNNNATFDNKMGGSTAYCKNSNE